MTIPALGARAVHGASSSSLRSRSLAELAEDCDSLIRLIDQRSVALHRLRSDLRQPGIPNRVRKEATERIESLLEADAASLAELHLLTEQTRHAEVLEDLTVTIRGLAELMRARQALASGLFVAADWHSPSISDSAHPNTGRHQGRISTHHDDYKRDRHPDEAAWEHQWLAEMVDNPASHSLRALMTASGMAAFTTILAHIEDRGEPGPVLMGAGTYHECRELLSRSALAHRIIPIPEPEAAAWQEALLGNPSAVFVDTMCNSAGLAVPDVAWLIETLHRRGQPTTLVIDNTARSVSFQPWRHLPAGSPLRLVSFESLTKYPQLGMDRAAGGVIVAASRDAEEMDLLREHLGTNIADVVVYQHPWPERRLLERRLARVGRNAALIADALSRRVSDRGAPFRVIYPGLSATPGIGDTDFQGGYLAIETSRADEVGLYRRLIASILQLARVRKVPICHGTSFGFDITRVYLTAADSRYGTPFLRVSPGNEHVLGAQAVAEVLGDALEGVS